MGNPNYRDIKAAPKPKPEKPEEPKGSEQLRKLGDYWGRAPVLKVGLGPVGNKRRIGKLWEDAQCDPNANITQISDSIHKQLQEAIDGCTFRTIWRKNTYGVLGKHESPKIKTVWLSDTGLIIRLHDFETQEYLAWEFEKWTAELMPGARVLNTSYIRQPRVCGLVINIDKDKLHKDFFKQTIEQRCRIFAKINPVIQYSSLAQVPYRVIEMMEISKSSWLITLNSVPAMKCLSAEPLNFFGVKICDVELVVKGRINGGGISTKLGRNS